MKNVQNAYALPGMISSAMSDCGRVYYSPIGNDRLTIDGFDVYQGCYLNSDGIVTSERPEVEIWSVATQLMRDVDAANAVAHDKARAESLQHAVERDDRAAKIDALLAKSDEIWS